MSDDAFFFVVLYTMITVIVAIIGAITWTYGVEHNIKVDRRTGARMTLLCMFWPFGAIYMAARMVGRMIKDALL